MEAWLYVDESQAPSVGAADAGRPFRVGALLLEEPVPDAIIAAALANLSDDPDARGNTMDEKTLTRGYFHASFDSANAHSNLTQAIVNAGLRGHFQDMQWRFNQPGGNEHGDSQLHSLVNLLGVLHVLQDDYDAVNLVVALRGGTFEEAHAVRWQSELYASLLASAAVQPNLPIRFPRVSLELARANDAGIQVCDMLLWAVQRARYDLLKAKGRSEWVERLGLQMRSASAEQAGPQASAEGVLGGFQERSFLPNVFTAVPRILEKLGNDDVAELLREIEADVREASNKYENQRIKHLQQRLTVALASVDAANATPESFAELARAFILVCDTLPIYDPADPEQCARAWEKRRVAALVCNQTDLRWISMARFWRQLVKIARNGGATEP
ncbi:hypothetical protein A2cp1_3057 [Anaeromyxobacter dehalogenans 2CP-1]|uniref:DUF3800 domain-containing protein n=1 Tax=Anaeromyxobacter dehalogenans (strain ATCC BAA-258 / DSM 21875 / 2CP-1) TaxID=455488 RepID=B8JFL5_ANAD2|nr:hypothetical protein [Anaeromyxobacter dehalogenans]ACL66392.1 hypothetical protein A2cp1_3057 [Anaeromyxobacter dehalogenans 2CP-1]